MPRLPAILVILVILTPSILILSPHALANYSVPALNENYSTPALNDNEIPSIFEKYLNKTNSPDVYTYDASIPGSAYLYYLNGWTYLHLEGSPRQIGYQYGYILANNISYAMGAYERLLIHQNTDWSHLRNNSMSFWPNIPDEYRQEMIGIADGLNARGAVFPGTNRQLDLIDVVGMNAAIDISYRDADIAKKKANLPKLGNGLSILNDSVLGGSVELSAALAADGPSYSITDNWAVSNPCLADGEGNNDVDIYDSCSGFAAAGDAVAGGGVLIGSETWFGYYLGTSYMFFLDIVPESGYHVQFQTFAGMIWSSTDWYVNSAGIAFAETTVGSGAYNYDKTPVFIRARKAAQYGNSLDTVIDILRTNSNGAYGNDWQMVDAKAGEAAILELGATAWGVKRTKNGFLGTCNFPWDPGVRAELGLDPSFNESTTVPRWDRLLQYEKQYYGKFDIYTGRKLLSDHVNGKTGEDKPNGSSSMCGHYEVRTVNPYCHGSLDAKVADSRIILNMETYGAVGHPCGTDFNATELLNKNANLSWTMPYLVDLKAYPWTDIARLQNFKIKVQHENGLPAKGVWVEFTNSVDGRKSVMPTDENGIIDFGKVTAGPYDINVYVDGHKNGRVISKHVVVEYDMEPVITISKEPSAFNSPQAVAFYIFVLVAVTAYVWHKMTRKSRQELGEK